MKCLVILICIIINSVSCWQYFTSVMDHILYRSEPEDQHIHSEYIFGDCSRKDIVLYTHSYLHHLDVVGKRIIRGWLNIARIPTCIILRAVAYQGDLFHHTAYNFQFCVPRITYCHSHMRYKYFYFEWYIPRDYTGGMNWDMYFFGSPELIWQ